MDNSFKEIPSFGGNFFINSLGQILNKVGVRVKPKIILAGPTVRLKKGRKTRTFKIRDLVQQTFDTTYNSSEIIKILDTVDWLWPSRFMYEVREDRVDCRVLYQGLGPIERDEFYLRAVVDAQMIFNPDGIFANVWKPSYRSALIANRAKTKAKNAG